MRIHIKNRFTNEVIFETDAETTGDAINAAIIAKADLGGADLEDADLRGADLRDADLRDANLRSADLRGADLEDANLRSADLRGADLRGADLRGADLRGADLEEANLRSADLRDADLRGADLEDANLRSADLRDADLLKIVSQRSILPAGDLVGWKKLCNGVLCKLQIPANSNRVGGVIGRKCRAEFAIVLDGEGESQWEPGFKYTKGATVKPDKFDPNPLVECSNGIHFFITRHEAECY